MRKFLGVIFSLVCFLAFSRYWISTNFGVEVENNRSRIAVISQKLDKLVIKAGECVESEKTRLLDQIDALAMERVLLSLDSAASQYFTDQWTIKLIYIGLKEKKNKGSFIKSYNQFVLERIKDLPVHQCNEEFQESFKALLKSLSTSDGKSDDLAEEMSHNFEAKAKQIKTQPTHGNK